MVITNSTGYWRQIDCTDKEGVPLPDTGNWPNVLAQTWNSSGTTFTAMKLNVTDTNSAAGSLLMDLQVGPDSMMKVDKTGKLYAQSLDIGGGNMVVESNGNITMTAAGTVLNMQSGEISEVSQLSAGTVSVGMLSITSSIAQNRLLASPSTASGVPTFRELALADVPATAKTVSLTHLVDFKGGSPKILFPVPRLAAKVVGARVVSSVAVTASNSNYWTFQIVNKGTGGTGTTQVLAASDANTTKSTGGLNGGAGLATFKAAALTLNGTTANRNAATNETLVFEFSATGTPADPDEFTVTLDFEVTGS